MEGILGIFQGIASSEYLPVYLSALDEHQIFGTKIGGSGVDNVVQTIGSLLMKSNMRPIGLEIFNKFLEQCTVEVLEQKGSLWTTLILKSCNARDMETNCVALFEALCKIAKISQQSADLTKTFCNTHLAKIYDSLAYVPTSGPGQLAALNCIETCLRLYPGSSGPAKVTLERYLMRFIDTSDEELNRCCGKCQHLLQQVRGGGVQGMNHKTQWQNYQLKLLGSLHSVLDEAFSKCTELYEDPVERGQLNAPALELSDEPVQRAVQLYIRFRNLCGYLVTALCEPFPVEKSIFGKKILNVINRGLAVTCAVLKKNAISDNLALGALLPKMHIHLLDLLQTLIQILSGHLKVYHENVLGLLLDALKWTSTGHSVGTKKPFTNLREKVYDGISLWCSTMRSGSRCEIIAELLIQEILNDVFPFQSEFTLKVLSGARKHMSKKARRQLHKTQNEQSNLAQTHANDNAFRKENLTDEGNQALCVAALRCLQEVLLSSSNFLKPTIIKIVQNKVLQISGLFHEFPLKRQQLYHNLSCRLEIYNTLYVLLITPHHLCPPPMQMALSILQTAHLRDPNNKVRRQCGVILLNLEKLIHPQKESLLFPADARQIRNTFIKLGQERLLSGQTVDSNIFEINGKEDENESDEEDDSVQDSLPKNVVSTEKNDEADIIGAQHNDTLNKDDVVSEVMSSDDSVQVTEYIEVGEKIVECSKSPELSLRVDDDEESSDCCVYLPSKPPTAEENGNNELKGPSAKKQKLENNNEQVLSEAAAESSVKDSEGKVDLTGDDDLLMADIVSEFVDELN